MKNLKTTLEVIILFISFNLSSQNFQWDWLKKSPDKVTMVANVTDNANNTIVAGSIYGINTSVGSTTYNASTGDGIIIKYDTNGNVLWSVSIGGNGSENCDAISADASGNIFVVGWTTSTVVTISNSTLSYAGGLGALDYAMFISKFNSSGNLMYFKTVSHGDFIQSGLLKLRLGSNSILLTDRFVTNEKISFGSYSLTAQNYDAYIASFDLNANLNWVKFYSTSKDEIISDLTIQKNDDIYFTGVTNSHSLVIGSNTLSSPSNSTSLGFIGRMNSVGNVKWLNTYTNYAVGMSLITAPNPNCVYLGFSFASSSLSLGSNTFSSQNGAGVIAQIDSMGNFIWSKLISGNNGLTIKCMAVNKNNHLYVIGNTSSNVLSTTNFSIANINSVNNFYFTAFDSQGNDLGFLISSRTTTTNFSRVDPNSISMDVNDNGYVVGYLYSDLICGTNTITSLPQASYFMVKVKFIHGLGIQESFVSNNDLIIFPNPTSSSLNFNSQTFRIVNIEICNALGQKVYQKQNIDLNQSLDVSFLNAGVYFVKIQNELSQKTLKVIKE